ncbi:MAG: peptidase dimerization domain-containing protein [Burkholderiales bacterium]|nr:peptidase dimerization domain-containing protein [Burkholderiales bacterium]
MTTDSLAARVLAAIDEQRIVQDVVDMVNIHSPTGSEAAMGDYMEARYAEIGLQVFRQEVEPGRPNIFGLLRGTGGGPVLQFDGHLDVSFTGREAFMRGGASIAGARVGEADGEKWIFGAGAYNMKAAHASYLAAVAAIMKCGIRLRGDIMLSATSGEIEASQVDEFQGAYYRGNGAGAAHAASHGIVPDFAILGEPTEFKLMLGHFGSFWSKISLTGGTVIHTAHTRGLPNKIEQLPLVIEALKAFKARFEQSTEHKGYRGLVNISAVQGGRPWKGSRSPDAVSLYIDVRFPPTWSPLKVKARIDAVVDDLNSRQPELKLEHQPYCTNPGTEISEQDYVAQALSRGHQAVLNRPLETSYELWYSNAPPLNAMGAQAVNYGCAGARKIKGLTLSDRDREYVHIGDVVDCAKVYALAALDICSKTRKEVRPDLF